MKQYFFFFLLLVSSAAICQPTNGDEIDPSLSVMPPSPSAAGLAKYTDFPISYTSGTPQISVPIYTLSGRGIQVPISLSYHSGGVKVDELSSCVGLNWSLNAGGSVSRTVMGKADERPDGFLQRGGQVPHPINVNTDFTALEEFAEGRWDGQPDVFNFNVGGYSGKFVFDSAGVVRLMPIQDVQISYELCNTCASPLTGSIISFTIKTPDGMVYTLGSTSAVEYSQTSSYNPSGGNLSCNTRTYDLPVATAWYLKTIYNPKTNDQVTFNYEAKRVTYDLSYSESFKVPSSRLLGSNCSSADRTRCVTNKSDDGVILQSIVSSYGQVSFVNDGVRTDIGQLTGSKSRLREIHIKGQTGGVLKKYKLVQSFISSSGSTPSDKPHSRVRMYLDEVEEYGSDDAFVNEYTFGYHQRDQLPPRLSFAQDHWGYYNGKTGNQQFTPFYGGGTLLDHLRDYFSFFQPADRLVSETEAQYGMLIDFGYPTGGSARFEYGSNELGICEQKTIELEENETVNARWTTTNMGETEVDTINIPTRQEVELRYDIWKIGIRDEGAWVRLYEVGNVNGPIFERGGDNYNDILPAAINGVETMWLDPGQYILEAHVVCGPDSMSNRGEEAFFSVEFIEEITGFETNVAMGGMRVERVTYDDGDADVSNKIIKRYRYDKPDGNGCDKSTAVLLGRNPQYTTIEKTLAEIVGGDQDIPCDFRECTFQRFLSSSVVNLSSQAGAVVNYREVWELSGDQGENGQTYRRYELFRDSNSELGPNSPIPFSNSPMVDRSYMNGKLVEETIQNATGDKLSERLWTYEFYESTLQQKVKGIQIKKLYEPLCPQNSLIVCDGQSRSYTVPNHCDPKGIFSLGFVDYRNCVQFNGPCYGRPDGYTILNSAGYEHYAIEWYDAVSQWVYLQNETSRTYDMDGSGRYVETTTNYGYDLPQGRHTVPTQTLVTNSDGKQHQTITIYSPEQSDPMATALQSWHMIVPMETQTLVDGQIVDGKRYTYSHFDQAGLPTYSLSSHPPLLYRISRREISWSSGGQLIDDGWDIKAFIGEYDPVYWMPKKVVQDGWQPDLYTWTDGLVTRRQYKDFIWQYDYDPNSRLMTRTTDIDGQVIDYSYDNSMRLQTTSSRGGNVVTSYEYNYQDGNTKNFVKTRTDFTPTVGSDLHWTESWQYLDGLGRPIQSVQRQHSPDQKDVVTAMEYDN
ncbi:MAG: DUF6443 domain-containing protein, partial [Bacteroidota bacterium]